MKTSPISGPVLFTFSDPTVVGVSSPTISGSSVSFTVVGVAQGSTTITGADASGATGSLTAATGTCGRLDNIAQKPVLLSPQNGATGVSPNVGKLYFGVYTVTSSPGQINLHMIAGSNQAFESGSLTPTVLPPGTQTAPPPNSGLTLTYMSGTIPTLSAGTNYRAQLYDDSCQPAEIAGVFST